MKNYEYQMTTSSFLCLSLTIPQIISIRIFLRESKRKGKKMFLFYIPIMHLSIGNAFVSLSKSTCSIELIVITLFLGTLISK